MYPSLSNLGVSGPSPGPSDRPNYGYAAPSSPQRPGPPQQQPSGEPNFWGDETTTMLSVKIAEEYKLAPPVQVPAALQASSSSQKDYSFDYERRVLQEEGSKSVDTFLQKTEASYYVDTRADKFLSMGFPVAAVHLALAYRATTGGDDTQIVEFCNHYTQLLGMGFGPSLAAGALVKTKNDLSAATDLCLSLNN